MTDSANEMLSSYLNDHLAASAAAIELVQKLRAENEGSTLGAFLSGLEPEIEADKVTLETVMDRLGVPPSGVKQLAGKVLEKLSRLRLNDRITGGPAVTQLMELETLSLGIEGKVALWRSLQQGAESRPELREFDLATLVERAVEQRAGVEPHRLASAAETFASPV